MRGPPRLRRRARLLIGENCIGKKQISLHSYEHESSSRDRSSCLRYQGVLTRAVLAGTLGYSQRCSGYSQGRHRVRCAVCARLPCSRRQEVSTAYSAHPHPQPACSSRGVLAAATTTTATGYSRVLTRGGRTADRTHAPLRKVGRAHGAVAAAVDVPKPEVERRRRKPAAATRGPMYQDRPTPA